MAAKVFTLRLPEDVYEQLVARPKKSVSGYVVDAVREKLARDRREELRKSYQNLVPVDMDEVEPWMRAQEEAMRHIDD